MDPNPASAVRENSPDEFKSPRKRLVLQQLREHDNGLTPAELSREVAASEAEHGRGVTPDDDSALEDLAADVYDSLHRTHLPTLLEWGYLEYDEEANLIFPADRTEDGSDRGWRLRIERYQKALYYAIPAAILACLLSVLESGLVQSADRVRWWVTLAGAATLVLVASYRYVTAARQPST